MKRSAGLVCVFLIILTSFDLLHSQPAGCQEMKGFMLPPPYTAPENRRSDTFNILKYTISLEVGNTFNQTIGGNTVIRLAPKINGQTFVRLDLLKLLVDSVKEGNTKLSFSHNDTILKVTFAAAKTTVDTTDLIIYYHGTPVIDATGWGGFYFDNTQGAQYAYNLGVGFGAAPHNYGRVWFPCFDNFVERSRYEFRITSDSARRAYCNGALVSDVVTGANRTRTWVLNQEIPSYLASITLAKYRQVNKTFNSVNGPKPVILASVAQDTSAVKTAFVNLLNCLKGFETYYGPYLWNRVGYCMVPFNSGAMEHATNITYPRSATGSLNYEELIAHELSHHWWGNLITCETQEDMWINEGFASFSAYMFFEWQYGKKSALDKIKNTHEELLHSLHRTEGFRPISGVPHSLTYGDHVYKKGADMAHTLRGYMGDSAFFKGVKYVMQQKAYKSINTIEFRDLLQQSSGLNLQSFFNNWIFAGGWSHFDIDSINFIPDATGCHAIVSLRQKLYGANMMHSDVPLEISFFDASWARVVKTVVMSGQSQTFTVTLPYIPVYAALNYDSKISDASSHEYQTIKTAGTTQFVLGKALVSVGSAGTDSSLLRIVHHYVAPDPFKDVSRGHVISDQHYWTVEGILSAGFSATLGLNYDGSKASTSNAYLDTLLTRVNGDSIGLFYRRDATQDWQYLRNVKKVKYNAKSGFLQLNELKLGQYTFANVGDTSTVGVNENGRLSEIKIFPNPAGKTCTVKLPEENGNPQNYSFTLTDIQGRVVLRRSLFFKNNEIDLAGFTKGTYVVNINKGRDLFYSQKLILE